MSGDLPTGCSMPMGISELLRMWKHWRTVSKPVGCCFVKNDPDKTGRRSDVSGQT
mgnify:FL=1